jgi:hypothetical protein
MNSHLEVNKKTARRAVAPPQFHISAVESKSCC